MHAGELRATFRDFAGQDGYRRFLRTLNRDSRRKGRLFFWQEQLWSEFVGHTPKAPTDAENIMALFRICDVHDCPLEVFAADDPLEIRDTPEFAHASDSLFPYASGGDLACKECRSDRSRWISENLELCSILRCQTTYEAYCGRQLEGLTDQKAVEDLKRRAKDKIKKRAAEIAALMQPGDELWEWDGGGWHHLAGRGGVAIVRNGKIVQRWCEIRS